ncbi:MAG: ECF transporter S component [Candidatus Bathyarchaeia archaeon]
MNLKTSPFQLAATAVFTALVCAATMIFSVSVPATQGFFNIGESMIFTSALLFGPSVGAFAGGVGSMLADILLGFPHYAPATLVVKACEGAAVGVLKKRNPKLSSKLHWKLLTFALGLAAGALLGYVGGTYYSGDVELAIGLKMFTFYIPTEFWIFLGAATAFCIAAAGFMFDPELGWILFSVIAGGFCMVSGYFLYEWLLIYPLFKIEAVALAEVPINIGQMIIGSITALPIVKVAWHSFPYLKKK